MPYVDSFDKIVTYFSMITNQPFSHKGVEYTPQPLRLSPMMLRGFVCPAGCGGCCAKFSLDFLPHEKNPFGDEPEEWIRKVGFDNKEFEILSDPQEENTTNRCRHLNKEDGRCMIHGNHPFSCDFELLRFTIQQPNGGRISTFSQKLFGRGWAMYRVDGGKGAKCYMTPVTDDTIDDVIRRLYRLKQWADYFGLAETKLPRIIEWCESNRGRNLEEIKAIIIYPNEKKNEVFNIFDPDQEENVE